jgi:hypothetical protein
MELLPDAKNLIKKEVDLHLEDHQRFHSELKALVREQKFWLKVIRVFAVIIAGGSIYGFLNFGTILDKRISQRISLLDQLPIAISHAEVDRWEDALSVLDGMWKPVIEQKKITDSDFIDNYIASYAWVLVSDPLYISHKKYNRDVERQWERLINHKRFSELEKEHSSDFSFQETLITARLKFAPSKELLDKSLNSLAQLEKFVYSDFQMADLSYNLAMIEILRGSEKIASEHLLKASELHPSEYLVNDWKKYRASFTGDSDYLMYSFVAAKLGINDFDEHVDRAFAIAISDSPSINQ